MNWRRGLFRTWLGLSLVWTCYALWEMTNLPHSDLILQYGGMSLAGQRWDTALTRLQKPDYALWLIGPPLAVLVAGGLALWAIAGFKQASQP